MKKTLLICTFIATTLTLFGCEAEQSAPTPVEIQSSTPEQTATAIEVEPPQSNSQYITETEAKMIALNHANLSESEVTALRITFEIDNGVPEYEVEFFNGTEEYDYEINATTGDIIGFDFEIEDKFFNLNTSTVDATEYITEAQAKEIALAHATLSESEITALRVKFDIDDGVAEYEVEFYNGNKEYDYEINATTGEIISFDFEIEEKFYANSNSTVIATTPVVETPVVEAPVVEAPVVETPVVETPAVAAPAVEAPAVEATTPVTSNTTQTGGYIGEEQAKTIALAHAGLTESSVTALRVKFDFDDGVAEYEVEFYVGNKEYDYEINATTGKIIGYDFDIENDFNSNSTVQTGSYITEIEAKNIALNHANVTESQVSNLKIKMDYDDGRVEYEIEWYIGRTEYDYEINATTGAILSFDVDND